MAECKEPLKKVVSLIFLTINLHQYYGTIEEVSEN